MVRVTDILSRFNSILWTANITYNRDHHRLVRRSVERRAVSAKNTHTKSLCIKYVTKAFHLSEISMTLGSLLSCEEVVLVPYLLSREKSEKARDDDDNII